MIILLLIVPVDIADSDRGCPRRDRHDRTRMPRRVSPQGRGPGLGPGYSGLVSWQPPPAHILYRMVLWPCNMYI